MHSASCARHIHRFFVVLISCVFIFFTQSVDAQQIPSYSFVSFDKGYGSLLSSGRSQGYQVKDEEINSPYGKYALTLEKILTFYTERIYLFFNEEKGLVSFTIEYEAGENQSRAVLDKLTASISEKLLEKYGPSENNLYPYYRVVENDYELFVKPRQSFSASARVTFRHLERVSMYDVYYRQEVERLELQEIENTVRNY
jgi:hypothetical protein